MRRETKIGYHDHNRGLAARRLCGKPGEFAEQFFLIFLAQARPFVLDFAGAYLDRPPDFPDETWAEWEAEKREQFDVRWPAVHAVLNALESLDIYMVDVSPSNIAFLT